MSRYGMAGVLGGVLVFGAAGLVHADNGKLDSRLEDRVENNLKNQGKFNGLDADVEDGVVTLKGEVATSADRARAERLARNAGARKVVNQLEVDPDKAAARVQERAEARKDAIDERAERQKDAIDRQTEATKDKLENGGTTRVVVDGKREPARVTTRKDRDDKVADPWVTTKVKTKILADDLLDKSEIDVDTAHDGVVTLTGHVPSAAAETRALELARNTEGARQVVDKLDVRPVKLSDGEVTAKVKSRLEHEDMLDKATINIETEDSGVVTLKGAVPSAAAETRALELTRTTEGVRKVVDKIDVKAPVVK
jgi:osmotically-inducible protein OsmY